MFCAAEVHTAGAVKVPIWDEAAGGASFPQVDEGLDAADFERGWQCYATSFAENFFLKRVVQFSCDKTRPAVLLSPSGTFGNAWLRAVLTETALTFQTFWFRVALRRRLRWPLPLSGGQRSRSCAAQLDDKGDHAAACHLATRLTTRAKPLGKTWARVLREAGARIIERVCLNSAALPGVFPTDKRHVEVVASVIPYGHGVSVAVDATLVSAVHANEQPFS